ncbi:hypothetical protein INR49_018134 [Caranx melampygus]|nr:hypothetical protein INR49_018134 [Caranx melampygus]
MSNRASVLSKANWTDRCVLIKMAIMRQFGLLVWKNYLQQKRQILVTLVEILLPLLFSCILIVLRQKVPFKAYPNATIYESYSVDILPKNFLQHLQLAYVPGNSSVVRQVAEDVRNSLSLSSVRGFETEEQFEEFVKNDPLSGKLLAAVVFEHPFSHDDEPLPLKVTGRTHLPTHTHTHSYTVSAVAFGSWFTCSCSCFVVW